MTSPSFPDKAALLPLFAHRLGLQGDGRVLEKTFLFRISTGLRLHDRVAEEAEAINHHPDWSNSYRTVKVRLTTHDAGGLTGLDLDLARRMDKAAGY